MKDSFFGSLLQEQIPESSNEKHVYLLLDPVLGKDIIEDLQNTSNHFTDAMQVSVHMAPDEELLATIISRCMASTHQLLLCIGNYPMLSSYILESYSAYKIPFQMGNISSDAAELFVGESIQEDLQDHMYLSNIIQLGVQLHLCPSSRFQEIRRNNYEIHRIGSLIAQIERAEPIMRDIGFLQCNSNILKNESFPAKQDFNPSGFGAESLLQLLKYASLHTELRFFHFHNFIPEHMDPVSRTYLSQLIWYMIQGVDDRVIDRPSNSSNVQEYVVEHDYYSFPLSFVRSKKTGRWWMKIPTAPETAFPYLWISCDAVDYELVLEGKIPNRLIQALDRGRD